MDHNTGKGGKGPLWEGTKNFTGRREREGRNGNGKQVGKRGAVLRAYSIEGDQKPLPHNLVS